MTKYLNSWLKPAVQQKHTASSPDITRSFSVPAATTPPSPTLELLSLSLLLLDFFNLNLYVGKASIDSAVAPLVCARSSLNPSMETIQGRQQQIVAQRMKGIAYPIQLMARNTIHNLQSNKDLKKKDNTSFKKRAEFGRSEWDVHHGEVPVQIRSIGGRWMPTKYPNVTNNKPNSKEAIQCHFEVFHQHLESVDKMN